MYNALNEQMVLQQAHELNRELRAARQTSGARRWWRRQKDAQRGRTRVA